MEIGIFVFVVFFILAVIILSFKVHDLHNDIVDVRVQLDELKQKEHNIFNITSFRSYNENNNYQGEEKKKK